MRTLPWFAPLSVGGHPPRFQSPRNVQQHSFGGPHDCSDVLVSGPCQGHDDKQEATDGRPHTSTPKLKVEHTHGRPGEGDTQLLGSAEGLANHVDEPPYPMELSPCPRHVDNSAISSSRHAIGPISLEISWLSPFAMMPVYSKYDHAILLYSAYPMKINRAAGQLGQTDVIIHFPPRVYGNVSAYHRPGDRPTMDVFPFAINAMKQENIILYPYNTTPSPQYVD